MSKSIFISLFIFFYINCSAQNTTFEVRDERKLGVLNAHVAVQGLHNDTVLISNNHGLLQLPDWELPLFIKITFIGYKPIEDTIRSAGNKIYHLTPDNVSLNEFVVTAQYSENNPDKVVQKIKIIDRQKIESMAAVNVEDVLSNELNIRINQDNVLGSGITMQGLSGENVKIMIDGVPIVGRQDGNIDLSQINLNDVERIEIVEGPLSVSYGTNALAGTINIITKKVDRDGLGVYAQGYTENIGTYNADAGIQYRKNKHVLKLSGGRNFFDGWHPNDTFWDDTKPQLADTNRVKTWNAKTQNFGRFHYAYQSKKWTFRYQPALFYEKITNRGRPQQPYYENALDDQYVTWRSDQSIFSNWHWKEKNNFQLIAAYNYYRREKNTFAIDLTTLDQQLSGDPNNHDTTQLHIGMTRGAYSFNSLKWFRIETGFHFKHEWINGQRFAETEQQGDYAVFASAEIDLWKQLTLRPGLRYGYNTAYSAPVTPSFNIKWGKENWSIRGSYARGFRAPGLKELYFYFVDANHNIQGNENLKAEQSHSSALNIKWQKLKQSRLFQVEAGGFYNHIDNQITLAQITGTEYSYVNIGTYKTTGGSLTFSGLVQHFRWNVGATYTGRFNQISEEYESDPFLWSPEVKANVQYEWKKAAMIFSIFYKYQGALPQIMLTADDQIQQGQIDAYNMLDATISKTFFKKQLTLQTGMKNILNVQNVNAGVVTEGAHSGGGGSTPVATGRIFFFKIKYQWNSKK